MKINVKCLILFLLTTTIIFSGCKDDAQAPEIYFLNSDGDVVTSNQMDTTILLYTVYSDPGISVEDNVSDSEDIIVESDIIEVLLTNTYGQVRTCGTYTVTYSATDEALNVGTATKEIIVENVAIPFTGSYSTNRTNSEIAETTYNSTISADSRISGRLLFPKVYAQQIGEVSSYFKLAADLYSPDYSTQFSETIAYTGTSADKETPFFSTISYASALETILEFDLLKIDAQEFTDDLGNEVQIAGRELDNLPLSRIEYVSGTKEISKIVLELNVTFNGVPDDNVIEVYTPND